MQNTSAAQHEADQAQHELALEVGERVARFLAGDGDRGRGHHDEPEQHDGRATSASATVSMCRPPCVPERANSSLADARSCGELLHGGGEHAAAMRVVAKHVEARAGRRQQHRVARLREPRRGAHRFFQLATRARCGRRRRARVSMSPASRPISTRGAHLAAERLAQRREVLVLAVAAGDHHQRARQARRRRPASRRRWCPWNR